jgi:hypothetical protein
VASLKRQLQEANATLREIVDVEGLARDVAQIEYLLHQATGKLKLH